MIGDKQRELRDTEAELEVLKVQAIQNKQAFERQISEMEAILRELMRELIQFKGQMCNTIGAMHREMILYEQSIDGVLKNI